MEEQKYYFKISPENIKGDIVTVSYTGNTEYILTEDPCCLITAITENTITGITGVYSGMTNILSGGTNGQSLLTGLTIPILLTEVATDIGYYSVFDGAVLQKDVITNFLFSATTGTSMFCPTQSLCPYTYFFYNTSDLEFKKFLSVSTYTVDWGDGSPIQTITSPIVYTHTYPIVNQQYTITLTANSPWGISIVTKTVTVPYIDVQITNPNGTATFTPAGGSWANTSFSYDYIFTGDSNTNINDFYSYNYTTVPFLISGYTQSTINDLSVYGPKYALLGGNFKVGIQVTGTSQTVGTVWGPDPTNTYTAYTINNINYYDYNDGTTIYFLYSSGFTQNDLILSAITKNEALINVIDQPEVQTDIYVERGKNSALERVERLGEVDNVGDLQKYGYGFFNVEKQ
jgi:hypothetical protein